MHKSSTLEETLCVGNLVEASAISIDGDYLDQEYVWVREYSRVTRIVKNKKKEVTKIRLAGKLIKSIEVSRGTKNPFHATVCRERVKVTLETIPDKI